MASCGVRCFAAALLRWPSVLDALRFAARLESLPFYLYADAWLLAVFAALRLRSSDGHRFSTRSASRHASRASLSIFMLTHGFLRCSLLCGCAPPMAIGSRRAPLRGTPREPPFLSLC